MLKHAGKVVEAFVTLAFFLMSTHKVDTNSEYLYILFMNRVVQRKVIAACILFGLWIVANIFSGLKKESDKT